MNRLFIIISLILVCSISQAQDLEQMHASDTLEVYFHQGSSRWDPEYYDNAEHLEAFVNRFKEQTESAEMRRITKIHIVAACSPEGLYEFNQRLSRNRAKSIRKVLADYITLPDSIVVERPIGINWPGLEAMVENDPDVPYRDKVLDIIRNSPELFTKPDGKTIELRKLRLAWAEDGKAWRYMYEKFFPTLRSFNLQIVVEWERIKRCPTQLESIDPIQLNQVETKRSQQISRINSEVTKPWHPFYMAAKTNFVYNALLIPNAGLEFYLGKGFSIEANYMHAWWKNDPSKWYWRTYGADIGLRYWLGKEAKAKPLTGHHVGIYGQVLTYDFELGNKGIIGGKPGGTLIDEPNWTVGIEYGYSLPVAKRLNIDFSIGVGYHWGVFYEYLPIDDCYVWQATKMRNYIGPTKLGVSLVWLIGKGNTNNTKRGGNR